VWLKWAVLNEIAERKEFLEEMSDLGRGDYTAKIMSEITLVLFFL